MAKVDILLASYNGGKYIEAQILSIIAQRYKDWRLLIHDDGSRDDTVEIIRHWQSLDRRICLLDDQIKHGSAAKNFMYLLEHSSADYIMFADQDDIWFDNKIEIMVHAIGQKQQDAPQVVYSNSYVWNPASGILGLGTFVFPKTLQQLLFLNSGMQGCVAIFNAPLRDLLKRWQGELVMHDHLLHLFAMVFGQIEYLPIVLMLYRRHESTVNGDVHVKANGIKGVLKNGRLPVVFKGHYAVVEELLKQYAGQISQDKQRLLEQFLISKEKNFPGRVWIVMRCRFQLYNSVLKLILKMILRPYIK